MKRWCSKGILAAGGLALILVGGTIVIAGRGPVFGPRARALTNRTFQRTPERLARGRYLVEAVAGCMDCHSPHDWTRHDAPTLTGMDGAGQDMSAILQGLPGRVVAPNLTPDPETGAGTWSDDALARAIREGIGHDGHALFPMMPYEHFRSLPDEDVASIVIYLRSLRPVRNRLAQTRLAFPVNYLIRSVPQPLTGPVLQADVSNSVQRGAFLVNAGGLLRLPHATKNGAADPRYGVLRRQHTGGSVGPGCERESHPGPVRHSLLRRKPIRAGAAHRLRWCAATQPDHALGHVPQHDRRGSPGHLCLPEDAPAGQALRR